mmetsp:Transcript_51984/g.111232  ORF Transcript_51984/g.111232 Transcript_51984/m.111232 type:complete len:248 (+) Transcript_51984:382-1125(+)
MPSREDCAAYADPSSGLAAYADHVVAICVAPAQAHLSACAHAGRCLHLQCHGRTAGGGLLTRHWRFPREKELQGLAVGLQGLRQLGQARSTLLSFFDCRTQDLLSRLQSFAKAGRVAVNVIVQLCDILTFRFEHHLGLRLRRHLQAITHVAQACLRLEVFNMAADFELGLERHAFASQGERPQVQRPIAALLTSRVSAIGGRRAARCTFTAKAGQAGQHLANFKIDCLPDQRCRPSRHGTQLVAEPT